MSIRSTLGPIPTRCIFSSLALLCLPAIGRSPAHAQPKPLNPRRPGLDVLGDNPTEAGLNMGTVAHRVQLDLHPAPAGHAPQIALVTNHQIPDGILGPGWTLEAASRIERRGPHGGTPGFETYWLDGRELVKAILGLEHLFPAVSRCLRR